IRSSFVEGQHAPTIRTESCAPLFAQLHHHRANQFARPRIVNTHAALFAGAHDERALPGRIKLQPFDIVARQSSYAALGWKQLPHASVSAAARDGEVLP